MNTKNGVSPTVQCTPRSAEIACAIQAVWWFMCRKAPFDGRNRAWHNHVMPLVLAYRQASEVAQ